MIKYAIIFVVLLLSSCISNDEENCNTENIVKESLKHLISSDPDLENTLFVYDYKSFDKAKILSVEMAISEIDSESELGVLTHRLYNVIQDTVRVDFETNLSKGSKLKSGKYRGSKNEDCIDISPIVYNSEEDFAFFYLSVYSGESGNTRAYFFSLEKNKKCDWQVISNFLIFD